MTRRRVLIASAAGAVFLAAGLAVGLGATRPQASQAGEPRVQTVAVHRGDLAEEVSLGGTLTYRAQADGSPYAVIDQARGTYTALPDAGDTVACGRQIYRVDDRPVLLLCGATPAYRAVSLGAQGPDVLELKAGLVSLGYATAPQIAPSSDTFGPATATALKRLQARLHLPATGSLDLGQAVFLPGPLRVADVAAGLGTTAQPGTKALDATSDTPEVQVGLDPSTQTEVTVGDPARVTLPSGTVTAAHVDRLGTMAAPAAQPAAAPQTSAATTVAAYLSLDVPDRARGLDASPVQTSITTADVRDVLSVPVTAVLAGPGEGYAVEVAGDRGRRDLVPVTLGLFDDADGLVQLLTGAVRGGDRVVVPSP